MRNSLALAVLLLGAPVAASAQEAAMQLTPASAPAPATELAATTTATAPEVTAEPVRAESRQDGAARAARDQFARRGSFWWMVGVIVVAGLILVALT